MLNLRLLPRLLVRSNHAALWSIVMSTHSHWLVWEYLQASYAKAPRLESDNPLLKRAQFTHSVGAARFVRCNYLETCDLQYSDGQVPRVPSGHDYQYNVRVTFSAVSLLSMSA